MTRALPAELTGKRAALVIAHPGHELRLYGWLELATPQVWVLTDGSGHGTRGRIESTLSLLENAGATAGDWLGRLADRAAYDAILANGARLLTRLVEELAAGLVEAEVDYVVADALEGFNPVHDLCRALVNAAIDRARSRCGRPLASFGFPLEAAPDTPTPGLSREAVILELDEAGLERKLAVAASYPELATEVERALATWGRDAFRRETLRPVLEGASVAELISGIPSYERYGEHQVAAGHYLQVLRFRQHFLPAVEHLCVPAGRV